MYARIDRFSVGDCLMCVEFLQVQIIEGKSCRVKVFLVGVILYRCGVRALAMAEGVCGGGQGILSAMLKGLRA